jgi:hypothetical protein
MNERLMLLMTLMKTLQNGNMTDYLAVGIAEGFELPESEEQLQEAWQYIYDKKLYLNLQGWFGRAVEHLITEGYIKTNENKKTKITKMV